MHHYNAKHKVLKTIESCQTSQQLMAAKVFSDLYLWLFSDRVTDHTEITADIQKKRFELNHVGACTC